MKIIKGRGVGVKGGRGSSLFFPFSEWKKRATQIHSFGYGLYEISIGVDLKAYNVIKKYLILINFNCFHSVIKILILFVKLFKPTRKMINKM